MKTRGMLCAALLVLACGGDDAAQERSAGAVAARTMPPASVSLEEFASLRWIEGTWQGDDGSGTPFFERYEFVDDSTIRAQSSADSTFPDVDAASDVRLRDGHVTTGDDAMEWAVTSISDDVVRFDPVRGARNAFEWRRDGDDVWTARLTWIDGDGVTQERSYRMRRVQ